MAENPEKTREVFRYFFSAYRGRTAIMVFLMVMAGLAEGIGVITLIPVLSLVEQPGPPESGLGLRVYRIVQAAGLEVTLGLLLTLIVASITTKAILLFFANRQVGYTVAGVVRDLRLALMRDLMQVRWSYFLRKTPGQYANAVVAEARRSAAAYQEACASLAAVFQMLAYLAAAWLMSWQIALVGVLAGVGLTLFAKRFFAMSQSAGRLQTLASKRLSARLVDVLQGVKALKAMGREGLVWPLLEHETQSLNLAKRKEVFAGQALRTLQEPILTLLLAVGLYFVLEIAGMPLSSALVLAFIFYRVVTHINTLQTRYQMILLGESAFFSFQRELEAIRANREVSPGKLEFRSLSSGIRLDGISFSYKDTPVLVQVDGFIPAGAFVAIHGESGTGKTTLADLLIGLHQPASGRILVDEVPLNDLDLASWRRSIGYVPQEMLLFNESILLNVTLGDERFSRDDVIRALRLADAWDFVEAKREGLDYPIGDRGGMLSGGQRQRIALARALLGEPKLLILDEVTSALDPATELAICGTLRGLAGTVTILSISHQTAMRDAADLVLTIREGELVTIADPVGGPAR